MKAGWRLVKLGELCKTGAGGTPLKSKKEFYEGGSIPWLLSGEVAQGEILKATSFITQKGLENSSAKLFPPNTVLVAMYGATAGQVGVLRIEASTNQAVCGILPNEHFLPEFLFYYLLSRKDELIAQAAGNAQPNISQQKIRDTLVPVVPLPEQQRIVAILDEAFAAIAAARANAEQNRQNARALFESYLQSVFSQRGEGWVDSGKVLSSMCELIVDCEHKTAPTQDEGFPSIRTPNIGKGKLLLDDVKRVSAETYQAWTRRAVPLPGDLIFAREAPAGNVAVVPDWLQPCLGQRTVLIRPKKEAFDSLFLTYLLLSPSMQEHLLSHSKGSTVQHINMKDIRALRLGGIPAIKEQRELARRITDCSMNCERLESLYQRKIEALDELKQSLLQQAFSGNL